ncbi:MAG: acyl carrier protein [Clostridia bacterium]|nr:acyl carrier protein [Clostridia bacterium]
MTLEKIAKILSDQLDVDVETINADTRIAEDLNADSLDVVELLLAVEDEFELEIPDEAIATLSTVGDVVDYIEANT